MSGRFCHLQSPVGWLELETDGEAILRLSFLEEAPKAPVRAEDPVLLLACRELNAYFGGTLRRFSVPVRPSGTDFQKSVWENMKKIPYGETATYGELAQAVGKPGASRAVGGACHNNPVAILLPCHRVVGKNGFWGGFGGGVWRKRILLELEGVPCGSFGRK